jgi:hypothetical protein
VEAQEVVLVSVLRREDCREPAAVLHNIADTAKAFGQQDDITVLTLAPTA